MCLFRDSEKNLPFFFKRLEGLEKQYDMEYYFYENDSKDNTVEELEIWMLNRKGKVFSEILDNPSFGHTTQKERMKYMTYYRNKLLDSITPLDSDYCFIIDSDVDYTPDIIEKYLSHMGKDVAMCTPFVKQTVKCNMCNCNKQSYYDTFAIQDKDNYQGVLLSCNPFLRAQDRKDWDNKKPVSVNSAFGGAALVRTIAVNNSRWDTKPRISKVKNIGESETGSCEHWSFCEGVLKYGKVIVIPTIETYVKIKDWSLSPLQIAHQQQLIDDPWSRWVANF